MQPVRQIKEMIALAMLAVSSYTDIRERYIYLIPLAVSTAGSAAITAIVYVSGSGCEGWSLIVSDLMVPALAGAFFIVTSYIMRGHIGPGDGFLIATLCMVVGLRTGLISFAAGSFMAAGFALMLKVIGKIRKRSIPFAPFITAGYLFVLMIDV